MEETYRQGDVMLVRISQLPDSGLKEKDNILARGEVTGHHHELVGDVKTYTNSSGQQMVQVKKKAKLTHQEHGQIQIPKGSYEVRIQREYSPQANRQVMD